MARENGSLPSRDRRNAILHGSSASYFLTAPGRAYLIYLPEGGEVSVDLAQTTGKLSVE
jgi:hypothetical protein